MLNETYGVALGALPVLGHCLCLLGDIGYPAKESSYADFILAQATRYEHVFVLAGNHEYYSVPGTGSHYESIKEEMGAVSAKASNVTFLDCTSVLYRGYRILGCTLWSETMQEEAEAVSKMNNYKAIFIKDTADAPRRRITVADTDRWWNQEVKWLQTEIERAKEAGEQVIVMTHYAPLLGINPHVGDSPVTSAFGSDLSAMMCSPVKAWLYGHTHWSDQRTVNGVLVVSNQLGYFSKGEHTLGRGTKFDPYLVVKAPPSPPSH
eukprot:TRINITY_DN4760_c0_g1_i2.p1 TRINITY_DN4760_c0_g1~~TRINITY_DN4760_c0_g1_i2.p1  ORF type:complete len:264 (+),score=29.86 TRINITY_DN4760_c0_g1_i2:323-1114(+)